MAKPYADIDQVIYRVRVWERFPDVDDIPLIDGLIPLRSADKDDLYKRLERMDEANVISSFELEPWEEPEPPAEFAVEGIYNFITGDIDHDDERLRAVWEGTAS